MAEVVIRGDAAECGAVAASIIGGSIRSNPATILGVATGDTPRFAYAALGEMVHNGLDVSRVTAFALDEYVGLPPGHPELYSSVLHRELVESVGLQAELVHTPDPDPRLLPTAGERYERAIESVGGIDVQILGIGANGHIGFNEPGSSLNSSTRLKTLNSRTREDNARFFASPEEVPWLCLTQGVGTILRAKHLVLLAFGEAKAAAVAAAVEGPVTAFCPASAIQLHPHVTVIVDTAAAASLVHVDAYREAEAGKPTWQPF